MFRRMESSPLSLSLRLSLCFLGEVAGVWLSVSTVWVDILSDPLKWSESLSCDPLEVADASDGYVVVGAAKCVCVSPAIIAFMSANSSLRSLASASADAFNSLNHSVVASWSCRTLAEVC